MHDALGADDRDQPGVRADLLHVGEHRSGSEAARITLSNVLHDGVLVLRKPLTQAQCISTWALALRIPLAQAEYAQRHAQQP